MTVHSLAPLWALSAAGLGGIVVLKKLGGGGTPLARALRARTRLYLIVLPFVCGRF